MLRTARITAGVTVPAGDGSHNPYWRQRLEVSLDCFVCERTGRTMWVAWGEESGMCSSNRDSPNHPAPLRLSQFDTTHTGDRRAVTWSLDYWSAPFTDAKRGQAGEPLTRGPWVRLFLGYLCPDRPPAEASGEWALQSNLVLPARAKCRHCKQELARADEPPEIRLLP